MNYKWDGCKEIYDHQRLYRGAKLIEFLLPGFIIHFHWSHAVGCSEYQKISKFWCSHAFFWSENISWEKVENGFFLKIDVVIEGWTSLHSNLKRFLRTYFLSQKSLTTFVSTVLALHFSIPIKMLKTFGQYKFSMWG